MSKERITIGRHQIGKDQPCYIIAEAGVNHNGDLALALELVRKAKEIGADCVKFQTFKAEKVVTPKAPKANYQLKLTPTKESQFDMLKALELGKSDYDEIIALCKELEIQFLSTPYAKDDADFLISLGVDAFKIASGQIVELDFLKYVASLGKPMIISTGMATLSEVYEAVKTILATGNEDLVVLQCTTNYPSNIEEANVLAMNNMGNALDVQVGYSDHVPNNYACYAAVALGARVIEKHFTLDNEMNGPDHKASLNPQNFKEMIDGIRSVEASLGNGVKDPSPSEVLNTANMRRSMVLNKAVKSGHILTSEDIDMKRPATGMAPQLLSRVVGRQVVLDLEENTVLHEKHLAW